MALGRKNYLFAGSDAGGDRAASVYSIVQTAKLNDVNPEAYLRETLSASSLAPTAPRNERPSRSPT
jgi:transposase